MKILVYSEVFWPSIGGIESVSRTLCESLSRLGHEVTLVTDTALSESPELSVSYEIVRCPDFSRLCKIASVHDIVYSNGTNFKSFVVAKLCGRPFVWTHPNYRFNFPDGVSAFDSRDRRGALVRLQDAISEHGLFRSLIDFAKLCLRKLAAASADRNIAISQHMNNCQKLPHQEVIYNPVDLQAFTASQADAVSCEFTFGFVGRLISDKGAETLLRAFILLIEKEKAAGHSPISKLQIIGSGPEESSLRELAMRSGVGELVVFAGGRSGDDLKKLIDNTSIFVIPSLWEEPMGVVSVELMAAKKPLIVSRRGALKEIAQDSCLHFENGDYEELSTQMELLRDDASLRERMASRGADLAVEFAPDKIAARYADIFADVCQRK